MKANLGGLTFDIEIVRGRTETNCSLVFLQGGKAGPIRSDTISVALEDTQRQVHHYRETLQNEYLPEIALTPGGRTAEAFFEFPIALSVPIDRLLIAVRGELRAFDLPTQPTRKLQRTSTMENRRGNVLRS